MVSTHRKCVVHRGHRAPRPTPSQPRSPATPPVPPTPPQVSAALTSSRPPPFLGVGCASSWARENAQTRPLEEGLGSTGQDSSVWGTSRREMLLMQYLWSVGVA